MEWKSIISLSDNLLLLECSETFYEPVERKFNCMRIRLVDLTWQWQADRQAMEREDS